MMRKQLRFVLFAIAMIFVPVFWFGLNLLGAKTGLIDLYRDAIDHYNSGEPWGYFDEQR